MGRLMYLFDFEFKRNVNYYIALIFTICSALVINLILNLKNYNLIMKKKLSKQSLEKLYNVSGDFNFSNLITPSIALIFTIGMLACLLYSIIIWERDFRGKNKSIVTLLTLPNSRMNIYLSKFLNIVALVYMYVMSFIVVLFIAYKVIPKYMLGNITTLGFVQDTSYILGMWMPYKFADFIGIYVFLISALISVIFTLAILSKCIKKSIKIATSIICILVILIFPPIIFFLAFLIVLLVGVSKYPLLLTILSSSVVIAICYLISNKLMNNKLEF